MWMLTADVISKNLLNILPKMHKTIRMLKKKDDKLYIKRAVKMLKWWKKAKKVKSYTLKELKQVKKGGKGWKAVG